MSPVQIVADALDSAGCRPRPYGQNIRAKCPVHGSRGESLAVYPKKTGDGRERAKVVCYAGCNDVEILDALGLTLAGLYDGPRPAGYEPPKPKNPPNFWDRPAHDLGFSDGQELMWALMASWDKHYGQEAS